MYRYVKLGSGASLLGGMVYTSYIYRPQSELDENGNLKLVESVKNEPLLLRLSRGVTMTLVTTAFMSLFSIFHDTKIVGDEENYKHLINAINFREKGRPLITVANHTSTLDDPGLMAWMVGFEPIFRGTHRWGVCKQEICFNNPFSATFTSLGQVLPVKKGLGIDQPMFKNVARRLIDGGWISIFPEAICIQSGTLGRGINFRECRDEKKANEVGALKWGVGKLIAHVRDEKGNKPPIVIPYYHVGMHELLPQYNEGKDNNKIIEYRLVGHGAKRIRIRVGKEIDFSDILNDYEHKNGPIRIARVSADGKTIEHFSDASESELKLYSSITKRIEEELLKLEKESMPDMLQSYWPPWAKIKGAGVVPQSPGKSSKGE